MIKIALRDVWAHATRFLMTILSVVLGVAFLSGTLALRTSLEDTFVQSFASTTFGTIQVEGNPISSDSSERGRIDAGAADTIRSISGVKDAQPVYMSPITVLQDGSPATGVGTVTLATGALTDFTPWSIAGKTPANENEIAFEAAALKRYDLAVGDRIEYIAGGEKRNAKIVGTVHLAAEVSPINIIAFDQDTARSLNQTPDFVNAIAVQTKTDANQGAVIRDIKNRLGADYTVRSSEDAIDEAADNVKDTLGFVTTFLLVFVVLALGVSTFIITNTFHMAVKARQKEFAYLRAVGASPLQIFLQVALQALVIGIVGSALGLAAGTGLLALASFGLLKAGMVTSLITTLPRDVIITSLIVGVAVTLVGAVLPARAAAHTAPVEAMREVSGVREAPLWPRALIGIALIASGSAGVYLGAEQVVTWAGPALGFGSGAVVLGTLVASPSLAKGILAIPALALRKTRLVAVRIGTKNAVRNPRRTGATAGALIIGMGLVTLGTVLASSVQASTSEAIQSELHADLTITPISPGETITDDAIAKIRATKGVRSVGDSYTSAFAPVTIEEETFPLAITTVDTSRLSADFKVPMAKGSLYSINRGQIVLSKNAAQAIGASVGDELTVFGDEGPKTVTVGGIHDSTILTTTSFIAPDTLEQLGLTALGRSFVTVFTTDLPLDEVQANVRNTLADQPTIAVYTKTELVSEIGNTINTVLAILYALLGLSIVVAIVGIINTLGLAVNERTTEIALMRAIGTSKLQIAGTIITEAILTSLYGTIIGILIGLGTGIGLVTYSKDVGISVLSIPWATLLALLAGTIVIGILAAVGPARRAARAPILESIAAE
ncbi:ABC transporter permease [Gleimia europaea]|uniref:ABC transporter permease n=1 Tax=Gleimia europaea ACS-120-V-Col10b TaxID=883069 RepID=A0A9W5REW4_9ACTO|nr:FtsX-like permease family protein [Gleimia europaea]EPD31169.1 hypothetical protein HMPREF9238_00934 [Gleimia europaea ACS-120-V-Col10b]